MTELRFTATTPGLDLPRGVSWWTTPDMVHDRELGLTPLYAPGEVAALFGFGRRWFSSVVHSMTENELGMVRREPAGARPVAGYRYSLHNIERFAHALIERSLVDAWRGANVILIVKCLAAQHGWHDRIQALEQQVVAERERARD